MLLSLGNKGGKGKKKRQSSADEEGTVSTRKSTSGVTAKDENEEISFTTKVFETATYGLVLVSNFALEYRAFIVFAVAVGVIAKYGDLASV